jgi:Mg-chelatase subunit ChlD
MTSQQAIGRTVNSDQAAKGKTSFINYENTFSSFDFPAATPTDDIFNIDMSAAFVRDIADSDAEPEPYLGIRFASALDGKGLDDHGRPPLSLVICLDISGSMGCSFSNDQNSSYSYDRGGNSKLDAAKKCIIAIGKQLRSSDDVAIVLFNHMQKVLLPMTSLEGLTPNKINKLIEKEMKKVSRSGGTHLANGLKAAIDLARQGNPIPRQTVPSTGKRSSSPSKLRRVMFLTDMESSQTDEDGVVELIRTSATEPEISSNVHCSVIGIGVDLSVGTVQSLSSIAGCRYMSVASTEEFTNSIADEFAHDVTPIALNIRVELDSNGVWTFEKGVGSAELNGISSGDMHFNISSEFPMPTISEDGKMKGGFLLFKLNKNTTLSTAMERNEKSSAAIEHSIKVHSSWTTIDGDFCSKSQIVDILTTNTSGTNISANQAPAPAPSLWNRLVNMFSQEPASNAVEVSPDTFSGVLAIRKGVALMKYVEIQNDYCLDDMHDSENTDVQQHQAWIDRIQKFKTCFEEELQRLGDDSLNLENGSNGATAQTLTQMIELENQEIKNKEEAHEKAKLRAKCLEKLKDAMALQEDLVPHSFLCPISKDIIEDAVIAADGHSYDRSQIERWLSSNGSSPKTGALLSSKTLIPNHSLQQAIQDFAANFDKPNSTIAAAAVAAANNAASGFPLFGGGPTGSLRMKSTPASVASRVTKVRSIPGSRQSLVRRNLSRNLKNDVKNTREGGTNSNRKRRSTGKTQTRSSRPRLSK